MEAIFAEESDVRGARPIWILYVPGSGISRHRVFLAPDKPITDNLCRTSWRPYRARLPADECMRRVRTRGFQICGQLPEASTLLLKTTRRVVDMTAARQMIDPTCQLGKNSAPPTLNRHYGLESTIALNTSYCLFRSRRPSCPHQAGTCPRWPGGRPQTPCCDCGNTPGSQAAGRPRADWKTISAWCVRAAHRRGAAREEGRPWTDHGGLVVIGAW